MVALRVHSDDGLNIEGADIFHAALTDDVAELKQALREGQSLDSVSEGLFTPIHLAIAEQNLNFLEEALKLEFNPWLRDCNERLPIDHASALGLKRIHTLLFQKMYPNRQIGLVVSEPAPS